jgi:hypothetical protein
LVIAAGGPEPRKDRQEVHRSIRESPHPMIRVGGPYTERTKSWPAEVFSSTGGPGRKPTLAGVGILRRDPFLVAGGPEPRKICRGEHYFIRESPHPMMRVGGPYTERSHVVVMMIRRPRNKKIDLLNPP